MSNLKSVKRFCFLSTYRFLVLYRFVAVWPIWFGLVWSKLVLLVTVDIWHRFQKFQLIMTQQAKGYQLWWFEKMFCRFGLVWFGDWTILPISCDICSQSKKFELILTQRAKGYQLWWLGKKNWLVWFGDLQFSSYLVVYAFNQKNWNWFGLSVFSCTFSYVYEKKNGLVWCFYNFAYILCYMQPLSKFQTIWNQCTKAMNKNLYVRIPNCSSPLFSRWGSLCDGFPSDLLRGERPVPGVVQGLAGAADHPRLHRQPGHRPLRHQGLSPLLTAMSGSSALP